MGKVSSLFPHCFAHVWNFLLDDDEGKPQKMFQLFDSAYLQEKQEKTKLVISVEREFMLGKIFILWLQAKILIFQANVTHPPALLSLKMRIFNGNKLVH